MAGRNRIYVANFWGNEDVNNCDNHNYIGTLNLQLPSVEIYLYFLLFSLSTA